MYTRHSNVSSGQYLLERGKSLEDLLINVVYKIFGECEIFNVYHFHNHIKFNICNRKADFYIKIIDTKKIPNDNLMITYYVGASF